MLRMRKTLATTLLAAFAVSLLLVPAIALADPPGEGTADATAAAVDGDNEWSMKKFAALAIGLGLGLAAAGGAMGQGRCAAAALDGIARNPGASGKIFTPMILGLALIESLVIYSLVISFMLLGKL